MALIEESNPVFAPEPPERLAGRPRRSRRSRLHRSVTGRVAAVV
jgi:hypothetical protein